MNIIICEYAPDRAKAFKQWLPDARIVARYADETIQKPFDAIIFSGGPMSAFAEDRTANPFLQEDMDLIKELAKQEGTAPLILGVCLGAQLVTLAFGGKVEKGETIRGWNRIKKTDDTYSPVLDGGIQFEFHSNHIVTPPKNSIVLASSVHDPIEAYRIGTCIYAVIYHPEITQTDAQHIYENSHIEPHEYHQDTFINPGPISEQTSQRFFQALFSKP